MNISNYFTVHLEKNTFDTTNLPISRVHDKLSQRHCGLQQYANSLCFEIATQNNFIKNGS